jgi:hypothetical protein
MTAIWTGVYLLQLQLPQWSSTSEEIVATRLGIAMLMIFAASAARPSFQEGSWQSGAWD